MNFLFFYFSHFFVGIHFIIMEKDVFRIVNLGATGVGKSALTIRLITGGICSY